MSYRFWPIVLCLGLTVPFFLQTATAASVAYDETACVEVITGTCGEEHAYWFGELDGAPYVIVVPDDWNGVLLVLAHGYYSTRDLFSGEEQPLSCPIRPDTPQDIQCAELLERDYALAASSYSRNGVVVDIGMRDTHALTTYFNGLVGRPDFTIITGSSMGGLITTALIEKFPGIYDAAITTSGPLAGIDQLSDLFGAYRLAYHVTFGWPPCSEESCPWGTYVDVDDDLLWGAVFPTWVAQYNSDAYYFFDFMRLVHGYPSDGDYNNRDYDPFQADFFAMLFSTHAIADAETYLGGSATSFDYEYTLSAGQIEYLEREYPDLDPQGRLDAMNDLAEHAPDPDVAIRNRQYNQSGRRTGDINRPVLSLAVIDDPIVGNYHETFYRDLVESAGKGHLLVNLFFGDPGGTHSGIPSDAMAASVAYVLDWLEAGDSPCYDPESRSWFCQWTENPNSPSFGTLGFDLDFEPPPWPLVPRDDDE